MQQKLHVRIAHCWNELRHVIDGAYRAYGQTIATDALRGALRGFARNIEQRDRFEELFAQEWSNERRDRRMRGEQGRGPVKVGDAAKLLILHNIVRGMDAEQMPASFDLFTMRESAHRAIVLGWLIGPHARAQHAMWVADTRALPMYYQAMQVEGDD